MSGRLVVLSGPSGVGKDTVIDAWRAVDDRVRRVVACTSRAPREGEVDGESYHFLTRAEFEDRVAAGDFLEYKEVHGNLYGTPLRQMEAMLAEGLIAILKIDVQGAAEVRKLRPDALTIILLPPSMRELEARIRGRAQDSEETIQKRLAGARAEMAAADDYQHQIVNDRISRVVQKLVEILEGS